MKPTLTLLTALLLLLSSSASAPAAAKLPPGVRELRNLPYVEKGHELQCLDLYLPEKTTQPMPVIIWVHGGGWNAGTKFNPPAIFLTAKGYAVASINYRLSQDAIFPAQIQDCKAAVRWLRAHAAEYNLDPTHFGAWGSSAGGHLVALLGTTGGLPEFEGDGGNADQSSRVQAVVDWFGPTDFFTVGTQDTRTHLLGGKAEEKPELAKLASPMHHVSKTATPFLVMHGDSDKRVAMSQSESFAKALQAAGVDAKFVPIPGADHGIPGLNKPPYLQQVEEFFDKHLKTPQKSQPNTTP